MFLAGANAQAKPWEKLENCTLIADPANDGDSFLISSPKGRHIFRLYFVDAPEIQNVGERTREQAAYFGTSPEKVVKVREAAADLAHKLMQKPFTVHTRWHGTRDKRRFYCLVTTSTGELAERLGPLC